MNKRADQFFNSVYIKSNYFDEFHFTNDEIDGQIALVPNRSDTEYKVLMEMIKTFLYKYRRKYLKEASNNYIAKLVEAIIPKSKQNV